MDEMLKERSDTLNRILPLIFKIDNTPPEKLLQNISIHLTLGENPMRITNLKAIRPRPDALIDKYAQKLTVVEINSNKICPLSQAPISKPWVGKCEHVFEESYILDYLKKKKDGYCPIKGCNKHLINKRS